MFVTSIISHFLLHLKLLCSIELYKNCMKLWFLRPYFSDTQSTVPSHALLDKKTVKTNQQLFVSMCFLTYIAWKWCIHVFAWQPICILNSNKWWLTSKCTIKGQRQDFGRASEERPTLISGCWQKSKALHEASSPRSRGKDLSISQ